MHVGSVFSEKAQNIFSWGARMIHFFFFLFSPYSSKVLISELRFCFLDDRVHYWKQQQVSMFKNKTKKTQS